MKSVREYLKKIRIWIIFFIILFILSIGFIALPFVINYNNIKILDEKLSLIEQKYFDTKEVKSVKDDEENIIFISVGNSEKKAIVEGIYGGDFESVYNETKNKIKEEIRKNNYTIENVKIDLAKTIKQIPMKQFESLIKATAGDYLYKNDIILDYENREDIMLIEGELNANRIIDYSKNKLDLDKLNEYLSSSGKKEVDYLPENVKVITHYSYICDDKNEVYELYNDNINVERRKLEEIKTEDIEEILTNSCNYLVNMIQDDGKFIYGYSAILNEKLESYNIVRHAGAIWALSAKCEVSEENKQKIESTIDYLISNSNDYDYEKKFIITSEQGKSNLGANGLALVAICEYIDRFDDSKYLDIARKIGNGIIAMQEDNGKLIHEINIDDLTTTREYVTEYYDNEATLALCKLYGITKDDKYLKSAEKSLQYFIKNDYANRGSHWFSYALNEVTKYVDREEYYTAGLQNIEVKLQNISSKRITSHTDFEMLLQGFELYDRILEKKLKIDELDKFPAKQFLTVIQNRANFQLNSYLYPEVAMYLEEPGKYQKTFYIRTDNFRIRIDDIQHSMFGYMRYKENKDKIENYLAKID